MKDDKLYLSHILEASDKIFDYTKNGQEEFINSPLIQDAVIRNFEIIGEHSDIDFLLLLSSDISGDLKKTNP